VEIIRIKGTPTKEEMNSMNHNLAEFNFPKIPDHTWQKVFQNRASQDCLDLISNLITYNPTKRLTPIQACAHYYYDELRDPNTMLPDGRPLPTSILFNFTPEEVRAAGDLYHKLNPVTPQFSQPQQQQQQMTQQQLMAQQQQQQQHKPQQQQQYGVQPMARPPRAPAVSGYLSDYASHSPSTVDQVQASEPAVNADLSSKQWSTSQSMQQNQEQQQQQQHHQRPPKSPQEQFNRIRTPPEMPPATPPPSWQPPVFTF
jgi:serine/threonine protein kinase